MENTYLCWSDYYGYEDDGSSIEIPEGEYGEFSSSEETTTDVDKVTCISCLKKIQAVEEFKMGDIQGMIVD